MSCEVKLTLFNVGKEIVLEKFVGFEVIMAVLSKLLAKQSQIIV